MLLSDLSAVISCSFSEEHHTGSRNYQLLLLKLTTSLPLERDRFS